MKVQINFIYILKNQGVRINENSVEDATIRTYVLPDRKGKQTNIHRVQIIEILEINLVAKIDELRLTQHLKSMYGNPAILTHTYKNTYIKTCMNKLK